MQVNQKLAILKSRIRVSICASILLLIQLPADFGRQQLMTSPWCPATNTEDADTARLLALVWSIWCGRSGSEPGAVLSSLFSAFQVHEDKYMCKNKEKEKSKGPLQSNLNQPSGKIKHIFLLLTVDTFSIYKIM